MQSDDRLPAAVEAGPDPQAAPSVSLDIGGSHVSAAVIDGRSRDIVAGTRTRVATDESASSNVIVDAWAQAALEAVSAVPLGGIDRLGIAVPAPFDYERGISLMQHKFQALYGVTVATLLEERFQASPLHAARIVFGNDADLFALGEWWAGAAQGRQRVIGLTLGTGFGSGFIADGRIVTAGPEVPAGGEIWNLAYRDGVAEDYVNGRAISATYARASGLELSAKEIAQRADAGDQAAADAFATLALHLANVLEPLVARFKPDCIVVGGNIARAWPLFGTQLRLALSPVQCEPSARFEDATLLGAAAIVRS